ncbi:MAG TPA: septum formation family protein, partial [Micromonosporaceae bacterium]|nr:septum formation family protein [Micromonosporaceae bacterium]
MRRRLIWVTVCTAAVALLAGCAPRVATDGNLTDDWMALPDSQTWSPKAGDCHAERVSETVSLSSYAPIPCTGQHVTEIVHVGAFTGEAAGRVSVPAYGSPEHRLAFGECVDQVKTYLGDDFRTGRVALLVGLPSDRAWSGGARWFTCNIWEYGDEDDDRDSVGRVDSLKGTLAGARPLGYRCYMITDDKKTDHIDQQVPTECSKSHNGEFVGIYLAKDVQWPKTAKDESSLLGDGCYPIIARYTGLPNDGKLPFRVSFVYWSFGETEWSRGNRAVRCILWLDKPVTKLMKGAGP